MIQCAILGATGYTGIELAKILLRHPHVKLSCLTSRQDEPPELSLLIPEISKQTTLKLEKFNAAEVAKKSDIVFICLPHTEAMETAAHFYKAGKIVIDLSADFRLKDAKVYKEWYKHPHARKELLKEAVYGLPELNRRQIRSANLIANPGCYPTSAILGLLPLLSKNLIETRGIVIDSNSGVSGAGKKITASTFFGEVNENFKAYKVNAHQHMPEIQAALEEAAHGRVDFSFVPHLLPVHRGILSTIYAEKKKGVKKKEIFRAFEAAYGGEPFVRFKKDGEFPSLRDVQHTNFCDVGIAAEDSNGRVIVLSAIDNLLKGASGQAVQNMNIRCGFPEESGLVS
ncbi:MAG: N-acetyl-gamma-glutamyl-phosphate reductase [Candidatus Omnitrophica bacterium]|nr:N-acetyl-gamma-glutamyl-phosphate reductase [Candidatus Omnitrophota bacterium]